MNRQSLRNDYPFHSHNPRTHTPTNRTAQMRTYTVIIHVTSPDGRAMKRVFNAVQADSAEAAQEAVIAALEAEGTVHGDVCKITRTDNRSF